MATAMNITCRDVSTFENMSDEEKIEFRRMACERQCNSVNSSEGNLNIYDGYNCDLCKNKGYVYVPLRNGDMYETAQRNCSCQKARRSILALKASGLESVVKDYRFDNYKVEHEWQKQLVDTAQMFLRDEKAQMLFVGGNTGAGKTHICTAVAVELLRRSKEVKYMMWVAVTRKWRESPFSEKNSIIDEYKDAEVLYIDDLFKDGRKDSQGRQIPHPDDIRLAFELINDRAVSKKVTIISSESTLYDIINIDEAFGSRIKNLCGYHCVNINRDRSKNYRLRGNENEKADIF
jgi:DNA replication protein DnaC